ncbi:amidohydrolase family protein [Candidatus Latescibacterota bacterium]
MNPYFERIHDGMPIDDIEIIDFHAHLGPYYNMHTPDPYADNMIRTMDRAGIDKVVVSATPGICSDIVVGNTMMLDAIKAHRGRIYGACIINGHYPELSLDELERCFSEDKDVVYIKLHPILIKCRMDDPRMKKLYEFASDHKLFILVHTWLDDDPYGNQDLFARVAADYPDINWLMGHTGGPHGGFNGIEIAEKLPNVFLDITMSMCPAGQLEYFVESVGADRVLFGTDNPFIDPRPQLGRLFLADISTEDKVKIAGGNVRKYIDFG